MEQIGQAFVTEPAEAGELVEVTLYAGGIMVVDSIDEIRFVAFGGPITEEDLDELIRRHIPWSDASVTSDIYHGTEVLTLRP